MEEAIYRISSLPKKLASLLAN